MERERERERDERDEREMRERGQREGREGERERENGKKASGCVPRFVCHSK
jgi:hypothetical protein